MTASGDWTTTRMQLGEIGGERFASISIDGVIEPWRVLVHRRTPRGTISLEFAAPTLDEAKALAEEALRTGEIPAGAKISLVDEQF